MLYLVAPLVAPIIGFAMAKSTTELAYLTVKNLKPKDAPYEVVEGTSEYTKRGAGRLLIRVRPTGTKEWYFRYKHMGKIVYYKVGTFPSYTVSEARAKYNELSHDYQLNTDVKGVLAKKAQETAQKTAEENQKYQIELGRGSFKQLTDAYVSSLRKAGKRSADEAEGIFERYVYRHQPEIESIKANLIDKDHIRNLLARMIRRGITTQSNRTRSYLRAAFQYGLEQDNDPLTYTIDSVKFHLEVNPVALVPRQKSFEIPGERVLSDRELSDLWYALSDCRDMVIRPVFIMKSFIRFVIAVGGQRILELLRIEWNHIDEERQAVVIPKENSKTARVHAVPLSTYAVSILAELKNVTGEGKYIFQGQGFGSNADNDQHLRSDSVSRTIARYRKRHADVESFNLQDIRRTVKTVLGAQGVDKQSRDRLQNHAFLDVSSVHYDRYDYFEEKKLAISAWDDYLDTILKNSDPQSEISDDE
jgi:integrase